MSDTRTVVIETLIATGNWEFTGGSGGPLQWVDLRDAVLTGDPPRAFSLTVALDRQLAYEREDDES